MSTASRNCRSSSKSESNRCYGQTMVSSTTVPSTLINVQFILCLVTLTNVTATLRGPPQVFSNYQKQQLVRSGDSLRLTCPVESDPQPLVEWQKDGETIHLGWSRFRLTDSALRIRDLEVADTGIYVCKATNGFGNVDVIFQVYVYPAQGNSTANPPKINFDEYFKDSLGPGEIPTFLRPEQMKDDHLFQMMGSTVRLRCRATGRPNPEIVWYKDGDILPDELSSSAPSEGSTSHWQLKLPDVKMNDAGRYTCKVFNKVGAINFTYTVQVIDPLSKPVIQDIQNTTVVVGDTLVLLCQIYSEDQPKVEWLKRLDRQNHRGTEYNRTITMQNERYLLIHPGGVTISTKQNAYLNKLVILDAKEEDGGMYLCSCASSMGFAFRSTFVTVLPGATSNDRTQYVDDTQDGYTYLPIIIAMTTVFGLVFLLGVIVFLHRRHVDNRRRKPKQTTTTMDLPRAPTMTSSFTCQSVDAKHDPHHYSALQSAQVVAPSQKYLLDNSHTTTMNNYVFDSRSDNSSILKAPMIQQHQLMHAAGHAHHHHHHQQQQQQYPQMHHVGHPLHLHYPLL